MPKNKMLILSGIYFNSHGNQSMMNSLKGYQKEYDLTLITAADLSSPSYLSHHQVALNLPNLKVISVWPYRLINMIRRSLQTIGRLIPKRATPRKITQSFLFTNVSGSSATIVAFWLRAYLISAIALLYVSLNRVHAVCAYEINGLFPLRGIKIISPTTVLFGKFQGTIMGPSMSKGVDLNYLKKTYPLDFWAMKSVRNLDCAIMTNDGTYGDMVLEYFGVENRRILLVPNGIDPRLEKLLEHKQTSWVCRSGEFQEHLVVLSVSRLASWKRVPLVVEAVGTAHSLGANIQHFIIGGGDETQVMEVRNKITKFKCERYVDILGPLSYDETLSRLQDADLLISLYAETNVCNPVLEALALGVPVLTIDDMKLTSVLREGSSGCFFVEECGSELLPARVGNLLASIDLRALRQKKQALEKYRPFTWSERGTVELEFLSKFFVNKA